MIQFIARSAPTVLLCNGFKAIVSFDLDKKDEYFKSG